MPHSINRFLCVLKYLARGVDRREEYNLPGLGSEAYAGQMCRPHTLRINREVPDNEVRGPIAIAIDIDVQS
ncbi:unnamed protein product [Rhizoctonia solani]|uniref:Uncharacterized protein n=1 Tax=Rhizoctonia solani TaxID=456999 RepID=A0A8H3DQJ5_9AGAM|nr:unnamed protein product [Rhizoctonia solani]